MDRRGIADVDRTSRRRESGKMVWAIPQNLLFAGDFPPVRKGPPAKRLVPPVRKGPPVKRLVRAVSRGVDGAGPQRVLPGPPAAVRSGDRRPAIFQSN